MSDQSLRILSRVRATLACLVVATLLFACTPALPERSAGDAEVQYIYGMITEVSPQQSALVIETSKGLRVPLALDEQSEKIGFTSLDKDLVEERNFKVWYVTEDGTDRILRIEKVPYLGC